MRAQMATPLLETKLHAPRSRQRRVERPRLADHMGRAAGAKLTLVSAPPGFGKTTLDLALIAVRIASTTRPARSAALTASSGSGIDGDPAS